MLEQPWLYLPGPQVWLEDLWERFPCFLAFLRFIRWYTLGSNARVSGKSSEQNYSLLLPLPREYQGNTAEANEMPCEQVLQELAQLQSGGSWYTFLFFCCYRMGLSLNSTTCFLSPLWVQQTSTQGQAKALVSGQPQ